MKRSRKSNRVSWASGFKLCQVKLFLSEESPSEVGMDHQYHLHAKPSLMLHSNITESHDLPPGFENSQHMNMEKEQHHIPQITWKCPPKCAMNPNWHVVGGEESEELVVQKLREMRVLEAVYPRVSAIPPCPVASVGIEEGYDDRLTPLIPIIPIEEEEEEVVETPSSSLPPAMPQTAKPILPCPDLITAAALTMKSDEIDTQLLMKIFSDPKMIESLTKDFGAGAKAKTDIVSAPVSGLKHKPVNGAVGHLRNDRMEPNFAAAPPQLSTNSAPFGSKPVNHLFGSDLNMGPLPQNKGNVAPSMMMPGNRMIPNPPLPMVQPCNVRDADYYKNLIKRHGGDNQERLPGGSQFPLDNYANNHQFDKTQNVNTGEVRPMNQKPCAYFNSPKGCRKGSNCNFRHEMALQKRAGPMVEARNAKRSRLGGELIGRT